MAVLVVPANEGAAQVLDPPQEGVLTFLQGSVGGYVERIRANVPGVFLWVNEEGFLRKLPMNPRASSVAGFPIYGTVVVTGDRGESDLTDVPQMVVDFVLNPVWTH